MKILDLIELTPPIRKFELKESEEKELKKIIMKQDELLHWISSYETNHFLAKKKVCPSPLGPNWRLRK